MELPLFNKLFGITSPSGNNEFLSEKDFFESIKTEISRLLETRVSSELSHRGNYNITKCVKHFIDRRAKKPPRGNSLSGSPGR